MAPSQIAVSQDKWSTWCGHNIREQRTEVTLRGDYLAIPPIRMLNGAVYGP